MRLTARASRCLVPLLTPLCPLPVPSTSSQAQGARGAGSLLRPCPAAAAVPPRLFGGGVARWAAGQEVSSLLLYVLPNLCPAAGLTWAFCIFMVQEAISKCCCHHKQLPLPRLCVCRGALFVRRGPGCNSPPSRRAAGRRRCVGRNTGARAVPAAGAGDNSGESGWAVRELVLASVQMQQVPWQCSGSGVGMQAVGLLPAATCPAACPEHHCISQSDCPFLPCRSTSCSHLMRWPSGRRTQRGEPNPQGWARVRWCSGCSQAATCCAAAGGMAGHAAASAHACAGIMGCALSARHLPFVPPHSTCSFARNVDVETSPDADTPRPCGVALLVRCVSCSQASGIGCSCHQQMGSRGFMRKWCH